MLEILYDKDTKEVRAWNADESVQGNLQPKAGQEVVIFPIDPPAFESGEYKVDLATQSIIDGNPDYVPVESYNAKIEINNLKVRVGQLEKK